MNIQVFDTHVQRPDGRPMHFDLLVPRGTTQADVMRFGRRYLAAKGVPTESLTTGECRFCHVEPASPAVEQAIQADGFAVIELRHCD